MMIAAVAITTAANASTFTVPASGLNPKKLFVTPEKGIAREILRNLQPYSPETEYPFCNREALREEGFLYLTFGTNPGLSVCRSAKSLPPEQSCAAGLFAVGAVDDHQ
jgi:hypothetical protein